MILWSALAALAAPPTFGVGAQGSIGASERLERHGGGLDLWGALALGGAFDLELHASVEGGDEVGLELRPGVRAWLAPRAAPAALSAELSAGADLLGGPLPLAQPGLALDLGLRRRLGLRIGAGVILGLEQAEPAARALRVSVGILRRARVLPPNEPPAPLAGAEVAPAPSASTLAPPPDGPMAWIPHPICAWVPLAEAEPLLAALGIPIETVVLAEGHLPALAPFAPGQGYSPIPGAEAPLQGGLLVLGHAGDRATVDGHAVAVGEDGAAVVNVRPGRVELEVTGGGSTYRDALTVVDGKAAWIRVPDPAPLSVLFEVDSATVGPAAAQALRAFAARAGDWRFTLQGGASPEGDPLRNAALAAARAEAVRVLLVGEGLPADRVAVGDPFVPDPALPLAEQRLCRVQPVLEDR